MSEQFQSQGSIQPFPDLINRLLHVEVMLIVSMNAQAELIAASRGAKDETKTKMWKKVNKTQ